MKNFNAFQVNSSGCSFCSAKPAKIKSVNEKEQLTQCGNFVSVSDTKEIFNYCHVFLVNVNFGTDRYIHMGGYADSYAMQGLLDRVL